MQKLLSIVIPVYKVEPYINKCLDSLLLYKQNEKGEQVLDDDLMSLLDILIINDGTPDRSAELSREYVKKYPKYFRQIDKENGGHGSAWNLGVQEAQGKYIRFLDSDDWLTNLGVLIEKLQHTTADLVITPTVVHCDKGEIWRQNILDMEWGKVYDANTFDWLGNRSNENYIFHHCCTYSVNVFRPYMPVFLEKQPYDDTILGAVPIIAAQSLVAFDVDVYHYLYIERPGQSMSLETKRKNSQSGIRAKKQVIEFVESHPVQQGTSKEAYWKVKLGKRYDWGYRSFVNNQYKIAKNSLKEWDEWTRLSNPTISTLWIKMYRVLPFWLYRIVCKLLSLVRKTRQYFNRISAFKQIQ